MRKREFLNELRSKLNTLSDSEREDIIAYYDELIEDKIEKTGMYEDEVVKELGSIDDIVKRVAPKNESKIRYDEVDSDNNNNKEVKVEEVKTHKANVEENKKKRDRILVGLIIAIVTFPIWFSILASCVGVIIGITCAGFGIGVAGVVLIVHGIIMFSTSFVGAAFELGVGLILIGLACVLAPLIVKLLVFIVKSVIKGVKYIISGLRGGTVYEN